MSVIPIHIAGIDPDVPVNLFAYSALSSKHSFGEIDFTIPENACYASELIANFHHYWQVVTFENAAIIVYAHPYRESAATRKLCDDAQRASKKLIFLECSESEPPTKISYGTLYRQSIFGNLRQPHEYSCASMHSDLLRETGTTDIPILKKELNPQVAFCGFAGSRIGNLAYRLLGQAQKADGLDVRKRVLQTFESASDINCRFIRRDRYLGTAALSDSASQSALSEMRSVFISNIIDSPYGIAVRGKGNHSVRFYELLSAGRIPVFINTNCVLPFSDKISYKDHVVWIEFDELESAGDTLSQFHHSLSEEEFQARQINNRALWAEWLSPLGFHRKAVALQ